MAKFSFFRLLAACLGAAAWGAAPQGAQARNVEAGTLGLSVVAGPSWRLDDALGGDDLFASLGIMAEWAASKHVSAVIDLTESPSGHSSVTRGHVGAKLRMADLMLPISPYFLVQVGASGLFNFLGARLLAYNARFGPGVDYMVSRHLSFGGAALVDLGATRGERPTFFGLFDLMGYVTWTLP